MEFGESQPGAGSGYCGGETMSNHSLLPASCQPGNAAAMLAMLLMFPFPSPQLGLVMEGRETHGL